MIDILAQAANVHELKRRARAMEEGLLDAQNREVVDLGRAAVAAGFSQADLTPGVRSTMARHVDLMESVGLHEPFDPLAPGNRRPNAAYNLSTKRVTVSPGVGLVLRQGGSSGSLTRFSSYAEAHGVFTAMGWLARPETTVVSVVDLSTDKTMLTTELKPVSPGSPDPDFRKEWGESLWPFRGINFSTPSSELPRQLTEKQVVVAAGYIARFNGLLDLVATQTES